MKRPGYIHDMKDAFSLLSTSCTLLKNPEVMNEVEMKGWIH